MRLVHNRLGYKRGCRCDVCRTANTAYVKARRKKLVLPEGDPRHGKRTAYLNWGCRCVECKSAQSEYMRNYYLEHR